MQQLAAYAIAVMLLVLSFAIVPTCAIADAAEPDSSVVADEEISNTEEDPEPLFSFPRAPEFTVQQQYQKAIFLQWKPSDGGSGYMLYRRVIDSDVPDQDGGQTLDDVADPAAIGFAHVATITSPDIRHWKDASTKDGEIYEYRIYAYVTSDAAGNEVSPTLADTYDSIIVCKVPYIKVASLKRSAGKKTATVKWKSSSEVDGYQIQSSTNSLFTSKKSYEIGNSDTASYVIKKLKKKNACYVRIRAYVDYEGQRFYGAWALSKNAKSFTKPKTSIIKKTKKVTVVKKSKKSKKTKKYVKKKRIALEVRSASKQKVYGFDALQASCTDGKYVYNFMNNKKTEKCRIVKIRIRDGKVVKVSKTLSVGHGNGATWNSDMNRIVVAHCYVKPMRLSVINPKTLKIEKHVNLKFSEAISGASKKKMQAIKKIASLSYDAAQKCYIVLLGHSHNILMLDGDFAPITYIVPSYRLNHTYQDITVVGDYIVISQSAGNGRSGNYLYVYERDGTYIKRMRVPVSYEIESTFVIGSKLHGGFYVGRWKSYYTTSKKTKKVKTKKTKKGNPVHKKKTVTVKKRHFDYVRSGYLYKYTSF